MNWAKSEPLRWACPECEWKGDPVPVRDLVERILAGDIMPQGECPDCRALIYHDDRD